MGMAGIEPTTSAWLLATDTTICRYQLHHIPIIQTMSVVS